MDHQPHCRFYVHFSKLRGPTVTFETQKCRRYFVLIGWLWNTDDRNFDRKPFELTVEEGNWPDEVADWRRWDAERGIQRESPTVALDGAIGYLRILEGAQPKIHDEGAANEYEEPPFQAAVYLDRDVYDAAERVCSHALDSGYMVSATLDTSSPSFPNTPASLSASGLDYSREIDGQVTSIELNPGAPIRPWSDDYVKPPKIDYNSPKLRLDISVTSCRVSYSMPHGHYGNINLKGSLSPGYEQSGINSVSIALEEYEKDNKGSYPKEGFPGRFEFHHENGWLSLELYYRSTDIEGPLGALLSARDEDKAAIEVALLIDPAAIRDGGKDVDGHVSWWVTSVFRNVGNL